MFSLAVCYLVVYFTYMFVRHYIRHSSTAQARYNRRQTILLFWSLFKHTKYLWYVMWCVFWFLFGFVVVGSIRW